MILEADCDSLFSDLPGGKKMKRDPWIGTKHSVTWKRPGRRYVTWNTARIQLKEYKVLLGRTIVLAHSKSLSRLATETDILKLAWSQVHMHFNILS